MFINGKGWIEAGYRKPARNARPEFRTRVKQLTLEGKWPVEILRILLAEGMPITRCSVSGMLSRLRACGELPPFDPLLLKAQSPKPPKPKVAKTKPAKKSGGFDYHPASGKPGYLPPTPDIVIAEPTEQEIYMKWANSVILASRGMGLPGEEA
jgi:hypothetical protein